MFTTEEELQTKLKPFEAPEREPLSKVPSRAIRQAVEDVEYVTAKGAVINMDTYGEINGQCHVCLAGAMLLARGVYRQYAHVAIQYRERRERRDKDAQQPTYIGCRGARFSTLENATIASIFNQLRLGNFAPLFAECATPRPTALRLTAEIEKRGWNRWYAGECTAEQVAEMCTTLRLVADYLEQEGF